MGIAQTTRHRIILKPQPSLQKPLMHLYPNEQEGEEGTEEERILGAASREGEQEERIATRMRGGWRGWRRRLTVWGNVVTISCSITARKGGFARARGVG